MKSDPTDERGAGRRDTRLPGFVNALVLGASALALFLAGSVWLVLFPPVLVDLGGAQDLDGVAARVRIPEADDALDGWFVQGTGRALVIVFHGYGRNHTRAWRYAGFLHRAGYSVLAVDFRSSREPHRKPTTLGAYELPDGEAALAWARHDPRTRGAAIGLLGESLGGSVALVLAARHPEVAAVIADCPFASGEWAMEDGAERKLHLPRWPTARVARGLGLALTGADPAALDVVAAAESLRSRPVFLIHARHDDRFSTAQAEAIWRATGSRGELWLAEGGHNQAWRVRREVYERRVLAFFDRNLNNDGQPDSIDRVTGHGKDSGRIAGVTVREAGHASPAAAGASRGARPAPSGIAEGGQRAGRAVGGGSRRVAGRSPTGSP